MSNESPREELEALRNLVIDATRMIDIPPDLAYRFELGRYGGTLTIFQRLFDGIARPLEELEAAGLLIPLGEILVSADETAEDLASRIQAAVDDQTTAASNSELRRAAVYRGMKDWSLATWRRHTPNANNASDHPPIIKIEFTDGDTFLGSTTNQAVYERQHLDDLRELALKRRLIAAGEVFERDQLIYLLMWRDAMQAERDEAVRRIQEDYARQRDDLNVDFKRQVEKVNAEFAERLELWKSNTRRERAAGEE